uniref:N-terminal methionine N(alpha)-acetyltransferase NatE n=1 Tax=Caenorhabditis tropicalis TaxID=1561998 RepID=A0A1I7U1U4_9PELO
MVYRLKEDFGDGLTNEELEIAWKLETMLVMSSQKKTICQPGSIYLDEIINTKPLQVLESSIFDGENNNLPVSKNLCRYAYYNDVIVGFICCEMKDIYGNWKNLYYSTIGVLPAYQRLGIGQQLLSFAVNTARSLKNVRELTLHARADNKPALELYKKNGFVVNLLIKNFYPRCKSDAYYLLLHTAN